MANKVTDATTAILALIKDYDGTVSDTQVGPKLVAVHIFPRLKSQNSSELAPAVVLSCSDRMLTEMTPFLICGCLSHL